MKKIIKAGAADQTIDLWIQDSASTTGGGKTGLAHNSAGLTCYYRKGATGSATALTLASQTVGGAHSDGGFVEVDATNMPGLYRLDLSDTIVATAGSVSLMLKGASGMAPLPIELQVIATDLEASALALGADLATVAGYLDTEVAAIKAKTDNLPAAPAAAGDCLTAAGVRSAVGLAAANLDTQIGTLATASALATVAGYLDTEVAAIKAKTDNLPAAPAATGDIPTATEVADALLLRDWTAIAGTAPARSALNALRWLRNKWSIAGGVLTVTKEDDATTAWTAAVSTDAAAEPVVGSDPA